MRSCCRATTRRQRAASAPPESARRSARRKRSARRAECRSGRRERRGAVSTDVFYQNFHFIPSAARDQWRRTDATDHCGCTSDDPSLTLGMNLRRNAVSTDVFYQNRSFPGGETNARDRAADAQHFLLAAVRRQREVARFYAAEDVT